MEKLTALAKNRGFIYPGSEIYGGLANTWDYGPLGVEFKNNIKTVSYTHLAIGHSARDTFHMLLEEGISMEQKPFSIGVRIEHPQKMIDKAQYGRADKMCIRDRGRPAVDGYLSRRDHQRTGGSREACKGKKSYHRHKEEARRSDRAAAEQDRRAGAFSTGRGEAAARYISGGRRAGAGVSADGKDRSGNGHPYNGRMCRDKFGDGSQHIPVSYTHLYRATAFRKTWTYSGDTFQRQGCDTSVRHKEACRQDAGQYAGCLRQHGSYH